MIPNRVRGVVCALALVLVSGAAEAGETLATPVCHPCRKRCYDPCQPVGPVRRLLRRVFLRPCPPPCSPPCSPLIVPAPSAPPVFLPAPTPIAPVLPPAANLGRPEAPALTAPPAPPPPLAPFPSAGASYRSPVVPPPPPPPVRVDRIASRTGQW